MNILIVGNGFDLSHYLPTKYDHFMDVMGAIEAKDTGGLPANLSERKINEWLEELDKIFQKRNKMESLPYHMKFDELYAQTRDPNFIDKTKEYYLTEKIFLPAQDVIKIQYRLALNSWYQYFKNHVVEIKTWIDFEQKIENVLTLVGKKIQEIEHIETEEEIINYFNGTDNSKPKINNKNLNTLNFFHLTVKEHMSRVLSRDLRTGKPFKTATGIFINIHKEFCNGANRSNGFSPSYFIDYLAEQLEDFIQLFNLYLEAIIKNLKEKNQFIIKSESWLDPDKIYSFNYTNTYQRIHKNVEVDYLHGSSVEKQNIVLGVSDLEDKSLKKIKAYGFTKYHQKLFKDTDYLFLDGYKNNISKNEEDILVLKNELKGENRAAYRDSLNNKIRSKQNECKLNLDITIWGHSLDVSDKDYIIDLFSLNDDMDRNVRVTVYYFNKPAKFALLNNLLAIIGKDIVEKWMKNKWLQFKENPEIKFIEAENQKIA
ncbi:AbiH family protein [Acinetobacter tibetensis]|uniref:Bacteriophage abortive infection AbiH family protein n=1 Tax=Acinetobacter tibetensis TaxID=2943497 RepID=A0AAE9LS61_9GAMM|nr:AbiH family protein [Acinetobacter tibetensis]USE83545.1 bacteriophage abortive infection AbiH family protein [Acinetobacter tibetensis]